VNGRYAYVRGLLLDALSAQATVMVDAEGQQQIVALIALIKTRGAHLDERVVIELAIRYQRWAPGQHSAAIEAVSIQNDRIAFAEDYFPLDELLPPPILIEWREEISISDALPDRPVERWSQISDIWLARLSSTITETRDQIASSLAQAEETAARIRLATIAGVVATLVLALALTIAIGFRLVRRMSIITGQAKSMADGLPAARTYPRVGGDDELGQLASAFDEMITHIETRSHHQEIESTALEALVQGAPLGDVLDRIALLFGTDDEGNARYRFTRAPGDQGRHHTAPTDALQIMAVDPSAPPVALDTPAARTAFGIVAMAEQRDADHHKLAFQATRDELTGLLNRGAIIERVLGETTVAPGQREHDVCFGVLYIDLDGFKAINDQFGHPIGDHVLLEQSRRMSASISDVGGWIGRLGGDEFLAVLPGLGTDGEVEAFSRQLVGRLCQPIVHGQHHHDVSASIGAISAQAGVSPRTLLHEADTALYEAKKLGGGQALLSTPELRHRAVETERLKADLLNGFAAEEFVPWYQPIWGNGGSSLVGLEALVRWVHPVRGVVAPGEFLPVVEELHLLPELDSAVFRAVCRQTVAWLGAGHEVRQVHVNISADRLEAPNFIEDTRRILDETGCPPSAIVAEVTESGLMTDAASNGRRLQLLREMGVRVAVDDFGQGYSSLAYLSDLPVDLLKIDRSFVDRIDQSPTNEAIVSAVLDLGRSLDLTVVAEGLERIEELEYLVGVGCQLFQGYLLGGPTPALETTSLLGRSRAEPSPRPSDSLALGALLSEARPRQTAPSRAPLEGRS